MSGQGIAVYGVVWLGCCLSNIHSMLRWMHTGGCAGVPRHPLSKPDPLAAYSGLHMSVHSVCDQPCGLGPILRLGAGGERFLVIGTPDASIL
jgi:hypothetical protein